MKIVSSFGDRLLEALENKKTSDVAKAVGLSKQAISAYTTGVRKPKPPTIHALAEYLNVSEAWLLGYDVPKSRENEMLELLREIRDRDDLKALFKLASKTSPEDVRKFIDIIKTIRGTDHGDGVC